MTRFASDISPRMRLFELLRQQNVRMHMQPEPPGDLPVPATQMDRFVAAAVQSLAR